MEISEGVNFWRGGRVCITRKNLADAKAGVAWVTNNKCDPKSKTKT